MKFKRKYLLDFSTYLGYSKNQKKKNKLNNRKIKKNVFLASRQFCLSDLTTLSQLSFTLIRFEASWLSQLKLNINTSSFSLLRGSLIFGYFTVSYSNDRMVGNGAILQNLHRFCRLPQKLKQQLFHFVSFTEQVFDIWNTILYEISQCQRQKSKL
ncbi:hypothetical protein BpHYR1_006469 [Brachionus plicatilis]|uniref:RNA-directed DNA polymerase from mobile element jockey-like n=1 Tax=Brachionus plicatilis TaxID=10195 RepID=A0A3M7PWG8_BRAPC|nr:hypothetical protein BpHYR1_006469 [Brachionus plicatilis]